MSNGKVLAGKFIRDVRTRAVPTKKLVGPLFALVLLTSCHEIKVDPPDPADDTSPLLVSAKPSWITLPVTVNLSDIATLVNREAPRHVEDTYHIKINIPRPHFHGMFHKPTVTREDVEVAHIDYHADRGDIILHSAADRISVSVPFSGGGRLVPPSVPADVRGSVSGSSSLTVAPDYSIRPDIALNVAIDHAVVLHGIGVHDLVQGKVNDAVNKFKPVIASVINQRVDLHRHAQDAWTKIPESIPLTAAKDVWITLEPQAVMLDGPHATADTVTAQLSLKLQVRTFLQATAPAPPTRSALPNLSGPPPDNKFHLSVPVEVSPEELNSQLSETIKKGALREVKFDNDKEIVNIKSATILPSGRRLYLKVGFAGVKGKLMKNVRGTLVFEAHPVLSDDKHTLSFDRIDYSAETTATLKGLGLEILLTVGKPIIISRLQSALVFPFEKPLDNVRSRAAALVNRIQFPPPLKVTFDLQQLSPDDLIVYGKKVYLGFSAAGSVSAVY